MAMKIIKRCAWVVAAGLISQMTPISLAATETFTYQYDALGRLVGAAAAGGPENATVTAIGYDKAGNRTSYAVTGASSIVPLNVKFIVVPLNGYTLIPVPGN